MLDGNNIGNAGSSYSFLNVAVLVYTAGEFKPRVTLGGQFIALDFPHYLFDDGLFGVSLFSWRWHMASCLSGLTGLFNVACRSGGGLVNTVCECKKTLMSSGLREAADEQIACLV